MASGRAKDAAAHHEPAGAQHESAGARGSGAPARGPWRPDGTFAAVVCILSVLGVLLVRNGVLDHGGPECLAVGSAATVLAVGLRGVLRGIVTVCRPGCCVGAREAIGEAGPAGDRV